MGTVANLNSWEGLDRTTYDFQNTGMALQHGLEVKSKVGEEKGRSRGEE